MISARHQVLAAIAGSLFLAGAVPGFPEVRATAVEVRTNDVEASLPWTLPPISRMEATNPAVWPPPPPLDPHLAALQELTAMTNRLQPPQLPPFPSAAELEPGIPTNRTQALEERELAFVMQVIKETDALLRSGEDEAALDRLRRTLPMLQGHVARACALNRMGAYEYRLKQFADAAQHIREAHRLDPSSPPHVINLAATLLSVGQLDEALGLLNTLDPALLPNRGMQFSLHFNLACAYSLKGDVDEGLSHLIEAARSSAASTLSALGDTQLDALRGEPGFQQLQQMLEERIGSREP